jgi:hypothetical protein
VRGGEDVHGHRAVPCVERGEVDLLDPIVLDGDARISAPGNG